MNEPRDFHPAAIAYLGCAAAFIAIGFRQPAFAGVGFAFLGLAIGLLRRRPSP
jgi:hypothetical protein